MAMKKCSATTAGAQFEIFDISLNNDDSPTVMHGKSRAIGHCEGILIGVNRELLPTGQTTFPDLRVLETQSCDRSLIEFPRSSKFLASDDLPEVRTLPFHGRNRS
jgi:hypothetical protein